MNNLPIVFTQVHDLRKLGINAQNIKFGKLTMESDRHICVREDQGDAKQIAIIDLQRGGNITRRPITAEGVIISSDNVIALRSGANVQSFSMADKKKLSSFKMPSGQKIVFWRYIDATTVAIVTSTSVYHWDVNGKHKKIFERHDSLSGCQIISYQASADKKWLLLVGIKKGASGIEGKMQLFSTARKISQPLAGHAGIFASVKLQGKNTNSNVFVFAEKKPSQKPKLFVMEVGKEKGQGFKLKPTDIPFPSEAGDDFPVSMQVSTKHDIVYMITKFGFLYLFDIHTGTPIFRNRVAMDPVFVTTAQRSNNGILGVTAGKGAVLSVSINERNLVPFVMEKLRNQSLALQLTGRLGLPGAEKLYMSQFKTLLAKKDIKGAATLASSAPGGLLRNAETIAIFQKMPGTPGQPPPLLQYFSVLLEKGKLNKLESIELTRPVVEKKKTQLLEKWLKEDKLEASEELGDLVAPLNMKYALKIYRDARCHEKVVAVLSQLGATDKIMQYSQQMDYTPNYLGMIQNLIRKQPNGPAEATKLAIKLAQNPANKLDASAVTDIFMQFNCLQNATQFLLEYLKPDRKEDGFLQTKLLEMNLMGGAAQVADAVMQQKMFSHYDKNHIAQLCERAHLFQRALEHYTDIEDIKRVVLNTQAINQEFLVKFLGDRTREETLACLHIMMQNNIRANLPVVVEVAKTFSDQLRAEALIEIFEQYNSQEGLYHYLGSVVNSSTDPEVHYKYIEASANLGKARHDRSYFMEVERVCRDSTSYDPERVKDFLIQAQLPEPRPLIHVCDRFGFVDQLTDYLYPDMTKYIAVYVQKVSPQKTPQVIGKLLDLDCDHKFIEQLLNLVRDMCPVDPLVEEVEKRNKIRMLEPWLEARIAEGNTEPPTHNAIGKIYITLNRNPQEWLLNNRFYDSKVIGKFCEKLDPYLAYIAYRRAWGACDEELIAVTNENSLFKDQARYLVERQDNDLWSKVLTDDNQYKQQLVDEVVATALPEAENPDMVSTTVKAFMNANLPHELIGLLERLVLQGTAFANNRNLQNLLILTAIKAAPGRVKDFIHQLDNFDGAEIAKIAVGEQYMLYEEAFAIYKKFELNNDAVDVLLNYLNDLERAAEYAERCNLPEVWTKMAAAQLKNGLVKECMQSYGKADDPSNFVAVIEAAQQTEPPCFEDLIEYLQMARKRVKEPVIDSELIFAFAKCDRLGDLEEFIVSPNVAKIQSVGDTLFQHKMYEAARLLFSNISNNTKLASCYVHLGQFREAVEAARKASSVQTWREVCEVCVAKGEFRLAKVCGLHIIVNPDHLENLINCYENHGYFEELIKLLEEGVGLEAAHPGIFSWLAIMYSRHQQEKLMEHLRMFWSRMHVPKVLNACEDGRHWLEAVFLYQESGDHDSAVRTMIEHSGICYTHEKFMDSVTNVRNRELYYNSVSFYLDENPMELGKLLMILSPNLDHSRVVHMISKTDNLPLVLPYLKSVQKEDISAVNEAINEIYIDEENYEDLRTSIDDHQNFDQLGLAQKIEKHELLEFRRIASYMYKMKKRWAQSVELSKRDNMFKDAIDTAAESNDEGIVNNLLRFFVEKDDFGSFCATLYTCYDLVQPDVAAELAWRANKMDFVMPYMIQWLHKTNKMIAELDARTKPEEAMDGMDSAGQYAQQGFGGPMAIASSAYNDPMMGGGGMNQMQMQQMQMQQGVGFQAGPNMGMGMGGIGGAMY
eukprot:g2042.t1